MIVGGTPGTPVWHGVPEWGSNYIIIAFGAADPNGSPVTDYQVSIDGGAYISVGMVTFWRHSGLTFGETHRYLVRAVNARGAGPAVGGSGSTTPYAVPPFSFCPNSGLGVVPNEFSIPMRTTDPADGALCSSIFWTFENPGQGATLHPWPAPTESATLRVRYSNGYGQAATTTVTSGGTTRTISWPSTGTWQNWQIMNIPVTIGVGATIQVGWSGPPGYTGDPATSASLNIDQIRITVP